MATCAPQVSDQRNHSPPRSTKSAKLNVTAPYRVCTSSCRLPSLRDAPAVPRGRAGRDAVKTLHLRKDSCRSSSPSTITRPQIAHHTARQQLYPAEHSHTAPAHVTLPLPHQYFCHEHVGGLTAGSADCEQSCWLYRPLRLRDHL